MLIYFTAIFDKYKAQRICISSNFFTKYNKTINHTRTYISRNLGSKKRASPYVCMCLFWLVLVPAA
jgi:hypothetical protein